MPTHTSNSASAAFGTSSPSGTAAPAGVTGKKGVKAPKRRGKFYPLVTKVRGMSSDQFRASLMAAGIIGKNGQLRKKYRVVADK